MKNKNLVLFYKIFAGITYGTGILLHLSRAILGTDFFMKYILTLNNDKLFSIPMILAAILSWIAIQKINFMNTWRKVVYIIIAIYTTISTPVHLKSWFSSDLNQLNVFPQSYSLIILPVLLFMLVFTISLKPKF